MRQYLGSPLYDQWSATLRYTLRKKKDILKPHVSKRNDGICFRIRVDFYVYILYLTAPPSILTLMRAHCQSLRSRLIQAKAYLKMNYAFLQHDKAKPHSRLKNQRNPCESYLIHPTVLTWNRRISICLDLKKGDKQLATFLNSKRN